MRLLVLFLLGTFASTTHSANILAMFTTPSPSHHIWDSSLVLALLDRGHTFTVLATEDYKPPRPNLTVFPVENLYQDVAKDYSHYDITDWSGTQWIKKAYNFFRKGCEITAKSNAFKKLLALPEGTKFDLLITEGAGTECLFGVLPKFGNPPIVLINAFSITPWLLEMTGTPNNPSFMPNFMSKYSDHMTFKQKVSSLFMNVYGYLLYHYDFLPYMDRVAFEVFGDDIPRPSQLKKDTAIVMSNFHPTFDYPWALSPKLIPVAGMQIKNPKPLPADLQSFIDNSKNGVIFFSLGSNVKSKDMPKEKLKIIMDTFAELPENVLWKFEDDTLPGRPQNVKLGKWLPQRDILAHPNVKLFITHAGLLSTHETIHCGVPVVGIPFIVDQHVNIQKLEQFGAGLMVTYKTLNKANFLAAIRKVIDDPSFRHNMTQLSRRFRDDPQTPLERAVFWSEYALRHGNARHLQPASTDMCWLQYYLLDVLFFLALGPIAIFVMLVFICRKISKKRTASGKLKRY